MQSRVDEMEARIAQQETEQGALRAELAHLHSELRIAKEEVAFLSFRKPTTATPNSPLTTTFATSSSNNQSSPSGGKRGIALFQSPGDSSRELARLKGELSRTKALLDQAATNGHLLQRYIASRRPSLNHRGTPDSGGGRGGGGGALLQPPSAPPTETPPHHPLPPPPPPQYNTGLFSSHGRHHHNGPSITAVEEDIN